MGKSTISMAMASIAMLNNGDVRGIYLDIEWSWSIWSHWPTSPGLWWENMGKKILSIWQLWWCGWSWWSWKMALKDHFFKISLSDWTQSYEFQIHKSGAKMCQIQSTLATRFHQPEDGEHMRKKVGWRWLKMVEATTSGYYPLVMSKELLKMTIYSGFTHWKWWFSIVM